MLLKKANRDIKLYRHMAKHYYIRKWIRKSKKKKSVLQDHSALLTLFLVIILKRYF
jgi:hypothetical protein